MTDTITRQVREHKTLALRLSQSVFERVNPRAYSDQTHDIDALATSSPAICLIQSLACSNPC